MTTRAGAPTATEQTSNQTLLDIERARGYPNNPGYHSAPTCDGISQLLWLRHSYSKEHQPTTEPAPIVTPFPILQGPRMIAAPPIHALSAPASSAICFVEALFELKGRPTRHQFLQGTPAHSPADAPLWNKMPQVSSMAAECQVRKVTYTSAYNSVSFCLFDAFSSVDGGNTN